MDIRPGQRLLALLTAKDESSTELVMVANGGSSIAIALTCWIELGLSVPWVAALVVLVFALLTGCLLFRYTVWIATLLGSAGIAAILGVAGAAIADGRLPHGHWVGGALGAVAGLVIGLSTYLQVGRRARAGSGLTL